MKAFVLKKYGCPELVLSLREVAKPSLKENEVLIRVKATAINDYDWNMVKGSPLIYRLIFGFSKPKHTTPGMEVAGTIVEIGVKVKKWKVGDAVYGDISHYGFGSFAEYLKINQDAIVKKPTSLDWQKAAATPHAFLLAWQAMQDSLKKNQKVLVNGAGGGVGIFALQIAKLSHCQVTGVDSRGKLATMKNLGYDKVLDYQKENFTKNQEKYDFILDCKSNQFPWAYLNALNSGGHYVTVGGKISYLILILLIGKFFSWFTSKKLRILGLKPNAGLENLEEFLARGKIKWIIDGPYSFKEIPQLIEYFGQGKHKGKIIITI